jgi:hypothetical protein
MLFPALRALLIYNYFGVRGWELWVNVHFLGYLGQETPAQIF